MNGDPEHEKGGPTVAVSDAAFLSDVVYPSNYFHELSPIHLNYVCALNGIEGPPLDVPFSYCELGCGAGLTVNILAASNPDGRFWGIDLSPLHIERAREMATRGEIGNVTFVEADITELDADAFPQFDYITLHGVYTWVPEEVRRAIVAFIDRKLAPGGVVYISYNTLPGWGSANALRRFFLDAAESYPGDALEKVARILDDLEDLKNKDAPFFMENGSASKLLTHLRAADIEYVAHEFLAPSWRPFDFAEVNAEMEGVGLQFAGSADLYDNLLEFSVPDEFIDRVSRITDRQRLETEKDFIGNRYFRNDLYSRAPEVGSGRHGGTALGRLRFGLTVTPAEMRSEIRVSRATVNLAGGWFDHATRILAFEALDLTEIAADPAFADLPNEEMEKGVTVLSFGGQLRPFIRQGHSNAEAPDRFRLVPAINREMLGRFDSFSAACILASPVAGSGVGISPLEAIVLRGLLAGSPVETVANEIVDRGLKLMMHEREITDDAERLGVVGNLIDDFRTGKIPKLVNLGIVEAVSP